MKLKYHIMRLLAPNTEAHRRKFRVLRDEVLARAEDLNRTLFANGIAKDEQKKEKVG